MNGPGKLQLRNRYPNLSIKRPKENITLIPISNINNREDKFKSFSTKNSSWTTRKATFVNANISNSFELSFDIDEPSFESTIPH